MIKDMFIWRKTIYENKFKCNKCGTKLFNPKRNQPTDNLVVDADDTNNANPKEPVICYCGNCQNAVATWQPIEEDEIGNDNILQGSYSEWIDRKAQDVTEELQKKVDERLSRKYAQKIRDLEDKIASRDVTIKNLKMTIERKQQEWDEKSAKLYAELEHADKRIEKLQKEIKQSLDEQILKLDDKLGLKEDK